MFARVSTTQVAPGRVDAVISYFQDAIPTTLEGMKGGFVLVDRSRGKVMTISLWETKDAMKAAAQIANEIRAKAAETGASEMPWQVDAYEVAVQL